MKPRKKHLFFLVAAAAVFLVGWALVPHGTSRAGGSANERRARIANPAADFCESEGHRFEVRTEQGSERGYCVKADGSERSAWDYYYEHHSSQE